MVTENLVQTPVTPKLDKKPSSPVSDFSPDDLVIVQKRHDWRLRVAHVCIEHFESVDKATLVGPRKTLAEIDDLAARFAKISDYVKRELPLLLATGVTVHELEAVRYQVNYFLEELVRHLRGSLSRRRKTKRPLQSSRPEDIEREVTASLAEEGETLVVFVDDVVRLAQFELEVESQRERIRLLLGGDRRLAGLGNNEVIMTSSVDDLWKAIDDFSSIWSYLRENLPPLLDKESPYPALESELKSANQQLQMLARRRIEPFEARLDSMRARETGMKELREHFCSLVGEVRTFLQTSFAHIASKDPRSTESSYHFFLREFSNEARQAILLLNEIRLLEALIHRLMQVDISGLPLTPENLSRILRVLFVDKDEEKKRIPSGEGWKVMSSFLEKLRDQLVPRLQKVCNLDGIRYEDKRFLSEWAMELAHNCTLCLAQHEIGYSLIKEMGRLRDDPATAARHSYVHIVTARTCRAMQRSLAEICMTLTASIPYVGIMRGGIERRASVFFHRQQKILEGAEAPAGEAAAAGLVLPGRGEPVPAEGEPVGA